MPQEHCWTPQALQLLRCPHPKSWSVDSSRPWRAERLGTVNAPWKMPLSLAGCSPSHKSWRRTQVLISWPLTASQILLSTALLGSNLNISQGLLIWDYSNFSACSWEQGFFSTKLESWWHFLKFWGSVWFLEVFQMEHGAYCPFWHSPICHIRLIATKVFQINLQRPFLPIIQNYLWFPYYPLHFSDLITYLNFILYIRW